MPESVGPFSYFKTREVLKQWEGGLVTDPPPHDLAPNELRAARNVFIRKRGFLQLRTGQRPVVSISTGYLNGFTRYRNASIVRLLYANAGIVNAFNEADGTTLNLQTGEATGVNYFFATMYDRAFWVNGVAPVMSWDGVDTPATALGIMPPSTAVQAYKWDTTAGGYTGIGLARPGVIPMQYYVTFVNARGVESNPNPISSPVYGVPTASVDLPGVHTGTYLTNIPVSLDWQVTLKNIYRLGEGLDTPFRITQIPNATTSYLDHTPNALVGSISLSFSHDVPPSGMNLIFPSKTRMFLADVPNSRIYVSTLGQPDYFPLTVTNPAVDGMVFDIEPEADNPIVALGGSGSAVIIARRKNMYLFQGDNVDNFTLNKLCDIGCVASRSLVQCVDTAVWLAPDGMVWEAGAEGPQCLTHETIARTLEAVSLGDLQNASACYYKHQYHLCIPIGAFLAGGSCLYLVYDFRVGAWTDLSAAYMNVLQLYSDNGASDTNELYASTAAGFLDPTGAGYHGIIAALGPATTPGYTATSDFDVWSGDLEFNRPDWLKRVYSIMVRGKLTPKAGTTPTLTLYARSATDSDGDAISVSYPLAATAGASGTLLATTVNAGILGQRISYRLQGSASIFELELVEITPIFVRERRQ